MDYTRLGKRIKEERLRLNLTQEKLSEKVGISTAYLGQIERGERCITLDKLIPLANYLGVTVDFLLTDYIDVQRFLRQILSSALFQKVGKGIGQQGIFRSGRLHFDFFHSGFLSANKKHSSDYSQRMKKFDEYLFARR